MAGTARLIITNTAITGRIHRPAARIMGAMPWKDCRATARKEQRRPTTIREARTQRAAVFATRSMLQKAADIAIRTLRRRAQAIQTPTTARSTSEAAAAAADRRLDIARGHPRLDQRFGRLVRREGVSDGASPPPGRGAQAGGSAILPGSCGVETRDR